MATELYSEYLSALTEQIRSTSSLSPTGGRGLIVFVRERADAAPKPTLSGFGVSWEELGDFVDDSGGSTDSRITAFGAVMPATPGSDTIDADFASAVSIGCHLHVVEVTDAEVDLSAGMAAALVGVPITVDALTLSRTLGDAGNLLIAAFGNQANETMGVSAGTGVGVSSGNQPNSSLISVYGVGASTLTATGTASDPVGLGFEFAAPAAGGTTHFASASLAVTAGVASAAKRVAHAALAAPSTFGAVTAAHRRAQASAAVPFTVGIASAAKKRAAAGLSAPFVFAPDVSARKRARASTALPLALGIDTAARRVAYGSLALGVVASVTTTAKRRAQASTVVPLVFTITTTASTGGEHLASASLEISFGASTSAKRRAHAAVALPVTVGTDTAARLRRQAGASLAVAFGADTAGRRRAHGSATLPLVLTITTTAAADLDRTRAFQGSGRHSTPATSPRTRGGAGSDHSTPATSPRTRAPAGLER